ncbi:hypothetical protein C8N35_11516 [Breoghania corrubedonensis]|uniref:Helix-turn-helix protein n=1 Tax=Breoghania corrubedonensis TaxID=665038 RepID=A0A2T5UQV6_9HYPH|nr:helix-turn-helix domain-containing protein [Breoghania corrubedonensis]PTW53896.1 hypothetical protein C8N35_11516 [Breoghania corrubedonensis]
MTLPLASRQVLALFVLARRFHAGQTQAAAARLAGVSKRQVSRAESYLAVSEDATARLIAFAGLEPAEISAAGRASACEPGRAAA